MTSALSLGARVFDLDKPLASGKSGSALIFDETYYVNAARVLLGIHPPTGNTYAAAPLFHDPVAEHPPLAKLIIAGTMKLFGDNPIGWRIGPVILGTVAILGLYWLVRSAGGDSWLALGAATLMAVDNLLLVHGRIATLDIFVVTFMIFAVALYLRGHAVIAGVVLGVGLCTKLIAVDVVFIVVLLELGHVIVRHRDRVRSRLSELRARVVPVLVVCVVGVVTYIALLFVLDLVASPLTGPGACATDPGGFHNPIRHTAYMICFAGRLTSPTGPAGIASYPWQWLINETPINYFTVSNNVFSGGKQIATHVVISFQGLMNPAIILLAIPALAVAARSWWVERNACALLALAWFVGTFLPFVVAAAPLGPLGNRTSYLYYMVVVAPAVYIGVAQLFSRRWLPAAAVAGYAVIVGYWFVALYPLRTLTGT